MKMKARKTTEIIGMIKVRSLKTGLTRRPFYPAECKCPNCCQDGDFEQLKAKKRRTRPINYRFREVPRYQRVRKYGQMSAPRSRLFQWKQSKRVHIAYKKRLDFRNLINRLRIPVKLP